MAQTRHRYERAFQAYLRERRLPYVAVDEARRALLPPGARLGYQCDRPDPDDDAPPRLKSFDFVLYGPDRHLLVEIKGRRARVGRAKKSGEHAQAPHDPDKPPRRPRLESWVTLDDIESLAAWGELFGPGFTPAFVFLYQCDAPPASALFEELFEHEGRLYALRAIDLTQYRSAMRPRSPRWRTVHLGSAEFDRLSGPLVGAGQAPASPASQPSSPSRALPPAPSTGPQIHIDPAAAALRSGGPLVSLSG